MTPTQKYLQPHTIFGGKTFDEYCSNIPEFYFKKEVPEDVRKNFEIVEQLLAHSYYEYRFIDEALAKALHTFEMAMSIRYKDFFPPPKKKLFFNDFIKELSKLTLFETRFETLKHVKDLRNYYSHPERHSFGGVFNWNKIEFISRLINEMYEDVNLRLERAEKTEQFRLELQKQNLDKGLVINVNNNPKILYSLELLLINNKHNPHTYLFACIPLFDLNEKDGSRVVPFAFKAKLNNPIFEDCTLTGESFSAKQQVKFSRIQNYPKLLPEYEVWNNEYSKKPAFSKISYEHSNPYVGEILVNEIEEYQRM